MSVILHAPIRVTVWNEFEDEKRWPQILNVYPGGFHTYLKTVLDTQTDMRVTTSTFYDAEHGLSDALLDDTDVLVWYSHMLQDKVPDGRINKVIERVVSGGMGVIFLHAGLYGQLFRRLVGPGRFTGGYREIGEKERVFVVDRSHPIAQGLPPFFEFPETEMYGEPGDFPAPDELVFISWYEGGEASRSGFTYLRGAGRVFYFSPGHLEYDVCKHDTYHTVLKNAIRWAQPPAAPPVSARRGAVEPLENLDHIKGGHHA